MVVWNEDMDAVDNLAAHLSRDTVFTQTVRINQEI